MVSLQLILYTALTPLIFQLLKKRAVIVALIAASFAVSVIGFAEVRVFFGPLERFLFQFNFFGYWLFGCLLARSPLLADWKEKAKKLPLLPVILFTLIVSFCSSLCFDGVWNPGYSRILVPLVALGWLVFLIRCFDGERESRLSRLGGIVPAIIVYGVHPFIGQVVSQIAERLPFSLPLLPDYFVKFVIIAFLSVAVAAAMKHWRWLKPLYTVFGGGR